MLVLAHSRFDPRRSSRQFARMAISSWVRGHRIGVHSRPTLSVLCTQFSTQSSPNIPLSTTIGSYVAQENLNMSTLPASADSRLATDSLQTIYRDHFNLPEISKMWETYFTPIIKKKTAFKELLERQKKLEDYQLLEAAEHYQKSFDSLSKMGKGTSMKSVQRHLLRWYEPLVELIGKEVSAILAGEPAKDRNRYGPYLMQLTIEKLAVITLSTTLNYIMRTSNEGEKLSKIALDIASMIETEVNLQRVKSGKDAPHGHKEIAAKSSNVPSRYLTSFNRSLRSIAAEDEWPMSVKVKLGAKLIQLLLQASQKNEENKSAFLYTKNFYQYGNNSKRMGFLALEKSVYEELVSTPDNASPLIAPRFYPMLVPPSKWDNHKFTGAYIKLKAPLMKVLIPSQASVVKRANISKVTESLDYLGSTAWRINPVILETIMQIRELNLCIADVPSNDNLSASREACYRTVGEIKANKLKSTLRYIEKVKNSSNGAQQLASVPSEEELQQLYGPGSVEEDSKLEFDERLFRSLQKKIDKKNAELHSLRCDLAIKIAIAEKFKDDVLYFPHNVDFRGRAYPVPPNLSHLGSDISRSLLYFNTAKPLGKEGFDLLKMHLANLFGNNKITIQERIDWSDAHLSEIRDSATRPIEGNRWWATAESPLQALATCVEIAKAIDSGNPETYECRLPVHQDGSCNGLQHYAGLGRDEMGARAVNLVSFERPQDVYSSVLMKVLEKIDADCHLPEDHPRANDSYYARMVKGHVNRKVIKQTVMTSVYGVTRLGARAQIEARLREVLHPDSSEILSPERESDLFRASQYLAGLTLGSLSELFQSAKDIMDWLAACAQLVGQQEQAMSWVTPLGLPVMQPYRRSRQYQITTVLQSVTLTMNGDFLPVSTRKQKTAFPPNFVHSLDSTHMMMTALKMKEQGLTFASVHDSYWTHACDVPILNANLREAFVELYSMPILEQLRESLSLRFPEVDFPPIPVRGTLDINEVKKSRYFFH